MTGRVLAQVHVARMNYMDQSFICNTSGTHIKGELQFKTNDPLVKIACYLLISVGQVKITLLPFPSSQASDFYNNKTTYCQIPIDGFNVVFNASRTVQKPEWLPDIYLAADTTSLQENVSETLTATITTTQGNPIDYFIDWTGLLENCTIDTHVTECGIDLNHTDINDEGTCLIYVSIMRELPNWIVLFWKQNILQTSHFFAEGNRERSYSTKFLLANEGEDTYKINISIWNAHRDPIYGHTRFVHNWTDQQVIVEYAIVDFIDETDDVWIKEDGRKLLCGSRSYSGLCNCSLVLFAAYVVNLTKLQTYHPSKPFMNCEWGDKTGFSPENEPYNNTNLNETYPIPHIYTKHNHYTYECTISNHVSELSFEKNVSELAEYSFLK